MSALLDQVQRDYPDAPSGSDDAWWQPAHLGGGAPTPEEAAALDAAAREAPDDVTGGAPDHDVTGGAPAPKQAPR